VFEILGRGAVAQVCTDTLTILLNYSGEIISFWVTIEILRGAKPSSPP